MLSLLFGRDILTPSAPMFSQRTLCTGRWLRTIDSSPGVSWWRPIGCLAGQSAFFLLACLAPCISLRTLSWTRSTGAWPHTPGTSTTLHSCQLKNVVFSKTRWSSQPAPMWNGRRGYPPAFMASPDLSRSLDWHALRATRWRLWKGWNMRCRIYKERRPSGCSGTRWRMRRRRPRRRPRRWLQLQSLRNHSSTSDRTGRDAKPCPLTGNQRKAFWWSPSSRPDRGRSGISMDAVWVLWTLRPFCAVSVRLQSTWFSALTTEAFIKSQVQRPLYETYCLCFNLQALTGSIW